MKFVKIYSKAILRNRDNKLDSSLNPTNLEYVFIHETAQVENYMRVLGKYKIVGNKPVINEETTQEMIDLRNELKDHYTEYAVDCCLGDTDYYSYTTACNYLEEFIDEVTEQLKKEEGGK